MRRPHLGTSRDAFGTDLPHRRPTNVRHNVALTACECAMAMRVWLQVVALRSCAPVSCQLHLWCDEWGQNSRAVRTIILNHVNVQLPCSPDDS